MKRIWVDRDKCLGCKSCELSCAVMRDSVSKTLFGALRESVRPQARVAVHGSAGAAWPWQAQCSGMNRTGRSSSMPLAVAVATCA